MRQEMVRYNFVRNLGSLNILEVSLVKYTFSGQFSFTLGVLSVFSTAFYSIRLLFLIFLARPNGNKNILLHALEST